MISAQTVYPFYAMSQESHLSVDPTQNNHDLKNIRQHRVHTIDQQTKDLMRLSEYEKH